jgi:NADH-quinone oxidoreductase subunit C
MADDPTKASGLQPPTPPTDAATSAAPTPAVPAAAAANPAAPVPTPVVPVDSPAATAANPAAPAAKPAAPAAKPAAPATTTAAPAAKPAAPATTTAAPAAKPAAPATTTAARADKPAAPAARPAAPAAKAPAAAGAEHAPRAAPPSGPPDPPPPAGKTPPAFIASLQAAIPGAVTHISYWVGDWTIIVSAAEMLNVARHLRDAPEAAFDLCSDVTATDWPTRAERFDLIYCLYSTKHRHRIRMKTKVAEDQPIPSVTPVWSAANWLEREVFDMFGVNFTGHPDRRRILMPDDWQGYPQRKDYPLEGPGELLMENPIDWLKLRQARDEADIE